MTIEIWRTKPLPPDVDHEAVERSLAALRALPAGTGTSLATLVVHGGDIVAEQYGEGIDEGTTLISWSMAKSITQAALSICVERGLLTLDQPAPVAAWQHDERRHITVEHLVQMRSGLAWAEEYADTGSSDVVEMLFGGSASDMAAYAVARPLAAAPGSTWLYSSGTTNILARIVTDALGGTRDAMEELLADHLFGPIGASSAIPKFDASGTFVGSSFVYATARDFALFGEMYRNGGRAGATQVVPAWAVARAAREIPVVVPADEPYGYTDHWWAWGRAGFPRTFAAHGFEGQRIVVDPARDLVVVQLSKNPDVARAAVDTPLHELVRAFPAAA